MNEPQETQGSTFFLMRLLSLFAADPVLRVDLKRGVEHNAHDSVFTHHLGSQLPATRPNPFLGDLGGLGVRKFRSPIAERAEHPKGRTHAKAAKAAKQ